MAAPKVLVVEDDTAIRTLVVAALKREPIEVHTASDGLAALECVRANDYAVILLDLMMPRLNGYEFLENLDSVRGETEPVVIVMTAFDTTSLRKLPPNRVHAVLHKPFDVERVVDLVRDCAFVRREERDEPAPLRLLPTAEPDEESPAC
ncbi:MAG TPA: response regulator [Thermoanaerobaculia bacterium]|nr:response regulator [Thermoanaerobaculia bacterium]